MSNDQTVEWWHVDKMLAAKRKEELSLSTITSLCSAWPSSVGSSELASSQRLVQPSEAKTDVYTDEEVRSDLAEDLSFEDGSAGNTEQHHEDSAAAIIAVSPRGMIIHGCGGVVYQKVDANHWVDWNEAE